MNLSSSAFQCGICTATKHEHDRGGETPWGDAICMACAETFEQCHGCGGYLEPSRIAERDTDKEPLCPECVKDNEHQRCDNCEKIEMDTGRLRTFRQLGRTWSECGRCLAKRGAA